MRKQWKQWQTLFSWAPKSLQMVTAAMKLRHLLLGRKAITNLDSLLKSRDIILLTKVCIIKAIFFPVIMHGCERWTINKAEHPQTDASNHGVREGSHWTARRSNQSILKKINPEYSWKNWCWSWSSNTLDTWCEELTHRKRPWCWERLKAEEKGVTEDEMVGWHHWLNEPEFDQTTGDSDGEESLVCFSPWGHKESDLTELQNNNKSRKWDKRRVWHEAVQMRGSESQCPLLWSR